MPTRSDAALVVAENVAKRYRLLDVDAPITATEAVLSRLRHPLTRRKRAEFAALDDVSLSLHRGEVCGLMGRNGAGKSTLLKLLSQVTAPSAGRITLRGRVGSLLEVGTGFHPELTGRENVHLGGALLGMSRAEVDRDFEAIVEFADVARFIDTPVKRYSSGMYVRLAFAVAAHLRCDVLLLDEVLAVGDVAFQQKCLARIRELAADGRAIILVSHNLQTLREQTDRLLLLDRGRLLIDGSPEEALEAYRRLPSGLDPARLNEPGSARHPREIRFVAASSQELYGVREPIVVHFTLRQFDDRIDRCWVDVLVRDDDGEPVVRSSSAPDGVWYELSDGGTVDGRIEIRSPWLADGTYSVDLMAMNHGVVDELLSAVSFRVEGSNQAVPATGLGRRVLGDVAFLKL